jgi:hypothetical protein
MADTEDFELDNEEELEPDASESDAGETSEDAPQGKPEGSEAESKRISDLMSKWQKADAENARLKAELAKAAKPKTPTNRSEPQGDEFMEFAREHARNTLFASDPRLAKYGVDVNAIQGDTPAEMRASLEQQRKLIDSLESRIRNEVLAEHGLDAEVASGSGSKGLPDIGAMSDEEFNKLMERRSRF